MRLLLCFLTATCLLASEQPSPQELAELISRHHGLQAWRSNDVVSAHVVIEMGGKTIIDHDFAFRVGGAEARMQGSDGTTVIYNSDGAWISPASAELPMARFHVLTWPWFIRAPFTVKEAWQQLGPVSRQAVYDGVYWHSKQTFGEQVGDSPNDWYGLLVDDAGRLAAMRYIVTYGKESAEAAEKMSLIEYANDLDFNGAKVATTYTFWHLDPRTMLKDGEPKGTGTVSDVRAISVAADYFTAPADARALPLP